MRGIKISVALLIGVGVFANAQSTVTTNGGSTNRVAKFSDNGSTIVDSVITETNANVGIRMTNPQSPLDVDGYLHVTGDVNPNVSGQGAYLGWNALSGGTGETDFINNQGGGPGGFAFMNVPAAGTPNTTLMFLSGATGNLGLGTIWPQAKLDVNGSVKISGSGASMTFPDNTVQSTAWNGTTCGGDYAESVDVAGDRKSYEPGDVLVIDSHHPGNFLKSAEPYATGVTGIFSTKPGLTGRRQLTPKSDDEVPMAMMGIVPTKVSAENGPIHPGDLLVSSSTPGYAMKGTDRSKMLGAVIGKALGDLDKDTGVMEVVVTLQ